MVGYDTNGKETEELQAVNVQTNEGSYTIRLSGDGDIVIEKVTGIQSVETRQYSNMVTIK